ncbi:MAG: DUF4037 domain-containing protein [Clostridia bacterium]|nr:DUF4037 domain-containing protein [Clostridia bacterium]
MKGIELAEKFYKEYGEKMIEESFPHLKPYLAIGLSGSGSECMGFDDAISRDHDFEPGFCIFLPDESTVSRRDAFLLERAYAKLPKEFLGLARQPLNPVGGNRHGVIRIHDFFRDKTGDENGELTTRGWFLVSEQFLLEATNGKIFADHFGLLSSIRQKLSYLPEDVRLKKLAGNLLLMAQAGQYNYPRCIKRGETGAAQLAMGEFVNAALKVVFLLNRKYIPYYKWVFKALRDLAVLSSLSLPLEFLLSSGNGDAESKAKAESIEKIAADIIGQLKKQALSSASSESLEAHAYSVNDKITDPEIRNLHIMYAV